MTVGLQSFRGVKFRFSQVLILNDLQKVSLAAERSGVEELRKLPVTQAARDSFGKAQDRLFHCVNSPPFREFTPVRMTHETEDFMADALTCAEVNWRSGSRSVREYSTGR